MAPLATFNLKQQAYERIRSMLDQGEFQHGQRISTVELAKRLGISRTPVREALSQLASQGFVRETPGFGVFLQTPDPRELRQLYAIREVLEAYAAGEAARHAIDSEIAQLERCCEQMLALTRHLRDNPNGQLETAMTTNWVKVDEKYHAVVLTAARNDQLQRTLRDMRLLSRTLDLRRGGGDTIIKLGPAAQTYRQHAALARAIRAHDPALADYWMRKQIRAGRDSHLADVEGRLRRHRAPA